MAGLPARAGPFSLPSALLVSSSPGVIRSFTAHLLVICENRGKMHVALKSSSALRSSRSGSVEFAHGVVHPASGSSQLILIAGLGCLPGWAPDLEAQWTLLRAGAFQKVANTSHFTDEETEADCHFLSVNVKECSIHLETCTATCCSAAVTIWL